MVQMQYSSQEALLTICDGQRSEFFSPISFSSFSEVEMASAANMSWRRILHFIDQIFRLILKLFGVFFPHILYTRLEGGDKRGDKGWALQPTSPSSVKTCHLITALLLAVCIYNYRDHNKSKQKAISLLSVNFCGFFFLKKTPLDLRFFFFI